MKLLFRTFITLALLCVLFPHAASAHGPSDDSRIESAVAVSASEARRLARRHLVARGYVLRIGPGGARVHSVSPAGSQWLVKVKVSRGASVQGVMHTLLVDRLSGVVRETEDSPERVAAN